jgi:hypothetical protein
MSNMTILRPLAPSALTVSHGVGGSNLLTPDPKEVWSGGGAAIVIDVDLGSSKSIDTIYVGYFDVINATWTVTGGAGSYTTTSHLALTGLQAVSSVAVPKRRHGLLRLAAPVANRYIRITVNPPDGATYMIGIVAVGLSFQPTHNREWGSGRSIIDTGTKEELLGGGFGIGEGARKAGYRWTFGDLTDAEVDALYDLALDAGETRVILVVEDPATSAGLNERIHYGLFDRIEAYERQNPDLSRWSLSMREWV